AADHLQSPPPPPPRAGARLPASASVHPSLLQNASSKSLPALPVLLRVVRETQEMHYPKEILINPTQSFDRPGDDIFSRLSVAMDGHRQAYRDVLVACRERMSSPGRLTRI